jgi:hypothetical protein
MENDQQIPINLEPPIFALTNAQIPFDQELFYLIAMSGNTARRYSLTPGHAKRLMLLLQKQVADYEKRFGELRAELPQQPDRTQAKDEMGFASPR